MRYPREVGSDTSVDEKDWNHEAPLGYCPACGSMGIEEIAIPGDPEMSLYCSDQTCRDPRGRRTLWGALKPQEQRGREVREGWSWNKEHFPGQEMPEICPD